MNLVGYARLHGIDYEERFKDISVICLDRKEFPGKEIIVSPEDHQVKEAYLLHYENAYPLSMDSKGLVIEGRYSKGHVSPFKWPLELKDEERKILPWQVMGVPAMEEVYFRIHKEDLLKIRELVIRKQ